MDKTAADIKRHQTLYVKDVLPAKVTRHVFRNDEDELKELIAYQIDYVKSCEEKFQKIKEKFVECVHITVAKTNGATLEGIEKDFLQGLLDYIKKEERKCRNDILGQQECVEMFKDAVKDKDLPSSQLEVARSTRNDLTRKLSVIIEQREIIFSALETLLRTPTSSQMPKNSENMLLKIKSEFTFLQNTLKEEQDKLKLFTNWQTNPREMRKGLKELKQSNGKM
ncbi:uncharacterized protein LOC143452754 [Clavelina lepadiformis]|uniref:uncharacterized protein LOC143452754 n=1 Tax=Clavelina lepadiformis TaxID=159417 RepID=UPI004042B033